MQFQLPDLGEGIVDAELLEWLVHPGETVEHGQSLAEVMTDKATLELPSSFAGKIVRLLVDPGEQVKVSGPLLEYEPIAEPAGALVETPRSETPRTEMPRAAPVRPAPRRAPLPAGRRGNGSEKPNDPPGDSGTRA
jgi:pyruvate/2-oxoglutarate dehydrogenase complex dihydrolipoamide acyltransferase (E2) component